MATSRRIQTLFIALIEVVSAGLNTVSMGATNTNYFQSNHTV
jgi:hypothetical protein